ncbi:Undecaprenyl pyrophosphate synthetase family protein [Perilla frutescens var. hirtella]|uniref:Alkyl transferase n=1 Tax=Perilla frutescens var. hirtella TaxID=608512 RepID=A0AAD4NZN9_PERFH|nr:Undecaprenyl pyrophosphate synthetase family protein [Perilla frutescens var. hirtella]
MESQSNSLVVELFGSSVSYMRRWLFRVLSVGPLPSHLAFILDGNRRYARKWNLGEGMGHRAGFLSLMTLMKYCNELGIKYITIYAFSIDNFKRKPDEVQYVMDLMLEKIEGLLKEESIVNQYGVRVEFVGNLKLLNETVRVAAEKAMKATANNHRSILLIAVAYTSTDEIAHAAQESCHDKIKINANAENKVINLADVERHMYMAVAPDPDILVRTSGETRLSNFLLWQTSNSLLYSPKALWPEIGLRHLVWAVLNFQRVHPYLERRKKLL